jgi:hypothetical protein
MPDENTTTLDESLISLMNNMIKIGMSAVPDGVQPEISSLVEQALARGALWLVRQIKPEQIKVLVEANADATAEIDWGEK